MARILKGSHNSTCTPRVGPTSANGMNHTCICLPSRSWYSFIDPGGMEGWVGLGWLIGYIPKCPAPEIEPGHGRPSHY